jgi:hypothetical protein
VVGLAASAKRLLPDAEVKSWHVGVHPNDSDEDLLAQLKSFDTVVSQLSDWDQHVPLRITRLRDEGLPVVYLPVLAFPGFHPDTTYIFGTEGLVAGAMSDYHSIIAATAYTLGLPEHRVPGLFNPYIFSELGYFDVFDAAKKALLASFLAEGLDIGALFDLWLNQVGQFMYTINHPHITTLAGLCRLALARAGHLDPRTDLPDDIDDNLAGHFVWPTYPALAKHIGLAGSNTFLRATHGLVAGQTREVSLKEYISACFQLYDSLPKGTLRAGSVETACERLATVIVAN